MEPTQPSIGLTLDQFKSIANQSRPQINRDTPNEVLRAMVGLTEYTSYTKQVVTDWLRSRVLQSFTQGHRGVQEWAKEILATLTIRHEVFGEPRDPYYELLWTIFDCCRTESPSTAIEGSWEVAIQAAANVAAWSGTLHSQLYSQMMPIEIAAGKALKRRLGQIGLREDDLITQINRAQQVLTLVIERHVSHFGGIAVAERIFRELSPHFDPRQERYHSVARFGVFGAHKPQQRLPIGLLLNMAAKHPFPKKPIRKTDRDWSEIRSVSLDLALLYQSQPSNNLHSAFVDAVTLLALMRRLATYDSLFSLVQLKSADMARILDGILDGLRARGALAAEVERDIGRTLVAVQAILDASAGHRGPMVLRLEQIASAFHARTGESLDAAWLDVLVHPVGTANKNFRSITEPPNESLPRSERAGANLGDKPLVGLGSGKYLLIERTLGAPAMIEATLSHLRGLGVDSEVGFALEFLLSRELTAKGFRVSTGKYDDWECDLVVETPSRVIFIETKKKSLTRAGRTGLDAALLTDIADSLVSAMLQAWKHETRIRQDGRLVLYEDGRPDQEVHLDGRRVERFAVTLPDFGSFQDKILVERMLASQAVMSFEALRGDVEQRVDKVNRRLAQLRKFNDDRWDAAGRPTDWKPFANCWFFSIPQLLAVLDEASTPDAFDARLNSLARVTTGSNDLYFELHAADFLRSLRGGTGTSETR